MQVQVLPLPPQPDIGSRGRPVIPVERDGLGELSSHLFGGHYVDNHEVMMMTDEIADAIKSGAFENAELADISGAALTVELEVAEPDEADFIDEVEAATGGCGCSFLCFVS